MSFYNPGQAVILPERLWSTPGVVEFVTVRSVDEIQQTVLVPARGEMQTVTFAELDEVNP